MNADVLIAAEPPETGAVHSDVAVEAWLTVCECADDVLVLYVPSPL